MKPKFKLVGSAKSLYDLKALIAKRWHWSDFDFKGRIDGTFEVHNSKGVIEGVRVIPKGGRWRFEMVVL